MKPIIFILLLLACSGYGARILGIFPFPARSHMIAFTALMQELARRGHEVTVITSFPVSPPMPNHTDIVVQEIFPEKANVNSFTEYSNENGFIMLLVTMFFFFNIGVTTCERALKQPDIQKIIHDKDSQFDLIIHENFISECFYGFMNKHKVPVINVSPATAWLYMGEPVGNPHTPSYIPDLLLGYSDHMTFSERIINSLMAVFITTFRSLYYIPKQNALIRKYFEDPTFPGIEVLETNASLLLLNSHFSIGYPRPFTPNTIEIGGLHIKPPKKLPKDLQEFMDTAKHGVIYFSLGSNVRSSDMPQELLQTFLQVFSTLKQQILWKWEKDSLPGQPPNVRLSKWLPQTNILAHPNLRLFITHGGLLSTMEALYREVPLLAIPVMADQKNNARKASMAGYALMLETRNITTQSLSWALEELLTKSSYRENVRRLSAVFRDQPEPPLDRAVYWTEYVLRHNGARHLRSAALDLHWYEYFLLDILAVVLLSLVIVILLCRAACRLVCSKKKTKDSIPKTKKKN